MPWAKRVTHTIPRISSPTTEYEFNDYSQGVNSFVSNDVLKAADKHWQIAQNARMPKLGEYETRKGLDFHSVPAGQAIDVQQTSTTGAADQNVSQTVRVAKKITFTTTGRCTRLDINLKNSAAATGTVMVELWSNSGGAPSAMLARTSIAASDIEGTYAYEIARFVESPSVTATDYWAVVYVQAMGSGAYKISSTTNASTGLTSTNSGTTWSASSVDYNVKAYLSTTGGTKGLHRAYKSDGTKVTLFAHGTVLYSVDETTGALTSVKTGLSASATRYRFTTVNDIVYYVNGFDGLRKLSGASFGTDAQVSSTNYTDITEHKGMLFLVTKDDPNKVVFSNFAAYETFTSTDFIYVPSPKTGDPVTALLSLNGYLLIWTADNKFILSGSDNATFQLDDAPDQKGTYTSDTVAHDKNFAYYLADDGVYLTNGNEAKLLSKNIYEDIRTMPNKDDAVMCVNQGRLYLWHTPSGEAANSRCWVFNLNFDTVESLDTDTFVATAVNGFRDDDKLYVASSLVGQVYVQELSTNDYTNLGGDIDFLLATHFMPFGSPAHYKEIRYWKPRFKAQSGDYEIDCLYGYDLRDSLTTQDSPNVQGDGYEWGDSGTVWGSFTWGTAAELQSDLYIPGEYRRIRVGYRHYATRQPQRFLGHTFVIQLRRLK